MADNNIDRDKNTNTSEQRENSTQAVSSKKLDDRKQNASEGQKKERLTRLLGKLSTILVILGVLGIILPFFNSFLLSRNMQIDFDKLSREDMQTAMNNAEMVPFDEIKEVGYVDFWPLLGKWEVEDIAGELHIPALDIRLAIFNSSANQNILAGTGLLFDDRKMGDANFAITGHHVSGKGVLLHNLMDAKLGQTVYVTDKEQIYVYRIIDTRQEGTDALYMLDADRNKEYKEESIISIMTCYQGKSSARWFVIGALEEVLPYSEEVLTKEYDFK